MQTADIVHHRHIKTRDRHAQISRNAMKKRLDKFIYLAVIIAPLANIPQLVTVWRSTDASGVSAVSWFSFAMISVIWMTYGLLHKDRPLLYMNSALLCTQVLIGLGAVAH